MKVGVAESSIIRNLAWVIKLVYDCNMIAPNYERYAQALEMRNAGAKLKEIAAHFNVSVTRARSMVAKANRLHTQEPSWLDVFTARTRNLLLANGFQSLSQLNEQFETLEANSNKIRNLGKVSLDEIRNVLGIENKKTIEQKYIRYLESKGYKIIPPST